MTDSQPEPSRAAVPAADPSQHSTPAWRSWLNSAQGWKNRHLTTALFRPQRLLCVGLDLPMVIAAVISTGMLYVVLNGYLCRQVDQKYDNLRLTEIKSTDSQSDAVGRVLQMTGMDKATELATALGDIFTPSAQPASATSQFVNLMGKWGTVQVASATSASDASTGTPAAPAKSVREALIRTELTGRRSGWPWWSVAATTTTGEQLMLRLEEQDPVWARSLGQLDDGVDKRLFLVRFADLLARRMQSSIRELNRWNGRIQWWTIFTMFLIVGSVARRQYTLWRLKQWSRDCLSRTLAPAAHIDVPVALSNHELVPLLSEACASSSTSKVDRAATLHVQFQNLREELDSRVYGTLSYLLGVLPSLGFIGTVLGMGSSLLEAEGLFSSQDKQKAIGNITQQLGFAFDTTFVALLAGILAGVLVCWMRTGELHLLRTIETGCLRRIEGRPVIDPALSGQPSHPHADAHPARTAGDVPPGSPALAPVPSIYQSAPGSRRS